MKKAFFIFAAAAALFITATAASAQRVGGYKQIAVSDAAAAEAADFAVSAQSEKAGKSIELISIFKAERQIVAGSNYRLCLKVNPQGPDGETDAIIFVQTVVYVDLKDNKKLTSWSISDCGKDDGN